MINFIRLHIDFLLTRIMLWITYALFLMILLNMVYSSQILEGYAYIDTYRYQYGYDFLNESFMVLEFVLVFISVYIGMSLSNKSNQSLMIYSIDSKKSKKQFVISRMYAGILIITLIIFAQSILMYAFTKSLTPYQIEIHLYIKQFLYLYLETIQYFMITILLLAVFNHFLIGFIPLIMFWSLEVIWPQYHTNKTNILQKILINIQGYEFEEKNLLIFIILYLFFTISYIIVLIQKDC